MCISSSLQSLIGGPGQNVAYELNKGACLRAKLLQPCPTLCDPTLCSPPGCSVHGIL